MEKHSVEDPLLVTAGAEKGNENAAAAEAKRLLRLAWPLVSSSVLQFSLQLVSVMFVGHLGELPLAGASLATSLANVSGFSLLVGMAGALDTLCGQAFGARQYHLLGVYKQRAMLVLALACVPIVAVWANTARILVLLGLDPAIAAEAGAYARWLVPALIPYVPLTCHTRFLQTQSIVLPVMACSGVTALAHVLVCWALVYKSGMGSKGAALSSAVSYGINLAMLTLYTRLSGACSRTWTGFSMEAFKELRQFAALAFPSAMMICLEWWSFELLVLLSGLLPNPQLETSVLSICLNTGVLMYMVALGLSTAISTRVSNELGAGKPEAAKLATRIVLCMALSEGLVVSVTMILLRKFWGYMYSNEEEVVAYIARMIPVLAISFFIDGIHSSLQGVLTRCGKQMIGARVNLAAFYLLGIPMAVLLAFVLHLNGMGLWLGIVCGSLTKLLLLMWIVLSINWEDEAMEEMAEAPVGAIPDSLRDLDHLKLLYDAVLRDGKLPGPSWRPQGGVRQGEIAGAHRELVARIQQLRGRVAAGDGCSVDYNALLGVQRGCARSEIVRAHLLLTLKLKPDRSASFAERLELVDEHRDLEAVRDQARMSALFLYGMLQKGYSHVMSAVLDEEATEPQRQRPSKKK